MGKGDEEELRQRKGKTRGVRILEKGLTDLEKGLRQPEVGLTQ